MTADQFNEKYKEYLEPRHYGCDIHDPKLIQYLDEQFQEFIKRDGFQYSQIKQKFETFRFYCDGLTWEESSKVEDELYKLYTQEPDE